MYKQIFFTNVLRLLSERGWTKKDLHEKSGISRSFLTDLTHGTGNPSLETMMAIADALEVPLTLLLEWTDLPREVMQMLHRGRAKTGLPPGYERVWAILPDHQAFIVHKWEEAARKEIGRRATDKAKKSKE